MKNVLLFLGLSLSLYATMAMAQLRGGLLPIDQAYKVSADIKMPGVVTVHFVIAPDYYLYRGRMKFIAGKDTTLGEPTLPAGKREDDPYFGEVEIYHNSVEATIPYVAAPGATSIHLVVGYQGCHEVEPKLCYPPHKKAFDLTLARAASTARPPSEPDANAVNPKASDASRYSGSPAARAILKAAKAARDSGNFDQAVVDYKKAVSLDPDYAQAQFEYLTAAPYQNSISLLYQKSPAKNKKEAQQKAREQDKVVQKKLVREYEALVARHPDDAIYPWSLGMLYVETDMARRESYCRQAVKIDPHFAQGYECLSQSASLRANDVQALAYQRKAMELAPNDQGIAGEYAYLLESSGKGDDAELKSLLRRFPDSRAIATILVLSTNKIKPERARIAALEQLRNDATESSKPTASLAAEHLYAIYIAGNLPKAKTLANAMAASVKGSKASTGIAAYRNKQWAARVTYVDGLMKAQHEIDSGQAQPALATLKTIESQKDQGLDPDHRWYLMQAKALDAAGEAADAFALLRDNFVADPSDVVQKALFAYGAKLGKTQANINGDVWTAFQAKAKPAPSFTLRRLDNNKPLSLSDYRGKVVIVDFWYPNCGPCHEAFPYLQKVAVMFKNQGLTVLAISSIKAQQDFALPFLRGKGYDFIGLAGNEKFAEDVYGVDSYPSTFLIGADGKIYMRPTLYDNAHERSTELAVQLLLKHAKR